MLFLLHKVKMLYLLLSFGSRKDPGIHLLVLGFLSFKTGLPCPVFDLWCPGIWMMAYIWGLPALLSLVCDLPFLWQSPQEPPGSVCKAVIYVHFSRRVHRFHLILTRLK